MNNLNVKNRTIFCKDNLDIMRGMNSECVDLIYLDPPFNKDKKFTAPVGSSAEGASFKDIFREEDLKKEWLYTIREDQPDLYHYLDGIKGVGKPYNFAYLAYMAIRLLECRRILKDTGSIYLHCDHTMSHYLKTTMDCIFGENNFRNEITWKRTTSRGDGKRYGRISDSLLFYAYRKATWKNQYHEGGLVVKGDQTIPLTGPGVSEEESGIPWRGYDPATSGKGRCWSVPKEGTYADWVEENLIPGYKDIEGIIDRLEALDKKGLIRFSKNGIPRAFRPAKAANQGPKVNDIWTDIPNELEGTGYPTEKPIALLERIIKASSNEGDVVLDPFCGCATTCVAAEKLDRKWIGVDVSVKAYELIQKRLKEEVDKPQEDWLKGDTALTMLTDPPVRTDQGADHREKKFVYVISHPNFKDEYKVGIAKDWKSRLNSYQTSDPERQYKIEYKLETPWFRETEQYIHDKFPNKHEWVQGELAEIIKAIEDHKPVSKNQDELELS